MTYTTKDYNRFTKAVTKHIQRFGLSEWMVETTHEQLPDGNSAQIQYNNEAKRAVISLTKSLSPPLCTSNTSPEDLALHEVLHLLLADLVFQATNAQDENRSQSTAAEHAVLWRLMRLLPR